jgi:hypothetical protein
MEGVTRPIEERLGDPGKVLLVLGASKAGNLQMEKDVFDTYLFLLREDKVLNLSYFFRFQPLPVSDLLRDDVYNLTQAGFIQSFSPMSITPHGLTWLRQSLSAKEEEESFSKLAGPLGGYCGLSRNELSRVVYARLAKPIPR